MLEGKILAAMAIIVIPVSGPGCRTSAPAGTVEIAPGAPDTLQPATNENGYVYSSDRSSSQKLSRALDVLRKEFIKTNHRDPGKGIVIIRGVDGDVFRNDDDEWVISRKTCSLFHADRNEYLRECVTTSAPSGACVTGRVHEGPESAFYHVAFRMGTYCLDSEDRCTRLDGRYYQEDAQWAVVLPSMELVDYAVSTHPIISSRRFILLKPLVSSSMSKQLLKKWRVILYTAFVETCSDWPQPLRFRLIHEFMTQELGESMANAYLEDGPGVIRW
ncbi:MAG: hypothetical protein JXA69_00785 [Phycisphaerae bacterium]|nr:hypothetical protein [Phycisphaerae bacterium]